MNAILPYYPEAQGFVRLILTQGHEVSAGLSPDGFLEIGWPALGYSTKDDIQSFLTDLLLAAPAPKPIARETQVAGSSTRLRPFRKASRNAIKLSYEEAKQVLRSLNISDRKTYETAHREGLLPGLPYDAFQYYRRDWVSTADFFGHRNENTPGSYKRTASLSNDRFLDYEAARDFLREQNIKSIKEYNRFRKANPHAKLPADPNFMYAYTWTGWTDFLAPK